MIRNTIRLEEAKKFRFSRKKSKYMVIKSEKGKIKEIQERISERGIIKRTDEFKYLGWWFREANNIRRQLHEIKRRRGYMVRELNIMGDNIRVGRHDGRIQ